MSEQITKQLDTLYSPYKKGNEIYIFTHTYFDGTPVNFRFYREDNKFSVISTDGNFSEWMANCTGDWKKASPVIRSLAKIYGASWDNESGTLYLRFRRNEMSVAQAVIRLQQAVAVIGSLGPQ